MKCPASRPTPRRAFTLIELLVVITIVAALVTMLLPAISKAREAAQKLKCASNERSVMIGAAAYATDFRGRLPDRGGGGTFPTYGSFGSSIGMVSPEGWELGNYIWQAPLWRSGTKRSSWTAFCLDYLDMKGKMVIGLDGSGNDSTTGFRTIDTPLHCPSTRITGTDGAYYASPKAFMSYMLNGFGVFNNYYGPAQDGPAGYPVLERITEFTNVPGGYPNAKIAMVLDVANHWDGGNVASADGSVKSFNIEDSFLLTNGQSCYVPKGYVVISSSGHDWNFVGSPTASEFRAYPMSQCYYWHPYTGVVQLENGNALGREHIRCFGYTVNGQ